MNSDKRRRRDDRRRRHRRQSESKWQAQPANHNARHLLVDAPSDETTDADDTDDSPNRSGKLNQQTNSPSYEVNQV